MSLLSHSPDSQREVRAVRETRAVFAPDFPNRFASYNAPAPISRRFVLSCSLGLLAFTLLAIAALPGRDTSRYRDEGHPRSVILAVNE